MSDIISEIREELLTCTEIKYKEFANDDWMTLIYLVNIVNNNSLISYSKRFYKSKIEDPFEEYKFSKTDIPEFLINNNTILV